MSRIKPYSHRTFLELSVGTTHTVEVLVHLRRSDLSWFNDPNELSDHQTQLFTLIGRRILPKECGDDIETDLAAWRHKRRKIGILIGEKNIAESSATASGAAAAAASASGRDKKGKKKTGKGRGKKGSKNKKGANAKAGTKTTLAALAGGNKKKGAKTKRDMDVQYLFADTLQVTYRVEDISTTDSVTLLFNDPDDSVNGDTKSAAADKASSMSKKKRSAPNASKAGGTLATYRQLKKLSKRIFIWVYPFDPANPTAPNPGGGFPRPELIPLTSLFVHGDDEE
mmetsp:Transcript_37601/g.81936  ORF Transcript_37601/g.81936 Transcript_37601/m.81936 type:complete len:283 (+) Transcript_37601:235-1083(+)